MSELENFQRVVAKALTTLAFVNVAVLAGASAILGKDFIDNTVVALALALTPAALLYFRRPTTVVAFAVATVLIAQSSLLVQVFNGHLWQIEMHFYYFVVLAMLLGFCDWRVLAFAAALIGVEHLVLNYLLPSAVFPGGSDFARVLVHAAFVATELLMLTLIAQTIRRSFQMADHSRVTAEDAAVELQRIGRKQEDDLVESNQRAMKLRALLDDFKLQMSESINLLNEAAKDLELSADNLATSADRAREQAGSATSTSAQTIAKVAAVAQAGNELAATISEIDDNISQASILTDQAVSRADNAKLTMVELTNAATEIGDMVGLINGIAEQTNLLSLNATIEAARAGAAGKSFAIVAQEVKALAGETAKATKVISHRTDQIQIATERSAGAIAAFTQTIVELSTLSTRIAAAIEQQNAATQEIAQSVGAAAAGVGNVGRSISDIESVTSRTADAIAAIRHSTSELAAQTSVIHDRIASFTDVIRSDAIHAV
jgi:methyl-accepting chemotaxis protein